MAVTARDVATRAGTSVAVVSYVLNDGPRPVATATRRRVLEAAEELGYRPNRIARALRTSKTGLVGVLFPDASSPYFSALARDLEAELSRVGKLTLFANSETEAAGEGELIDVFADVQVDGMIVVASETSASRRSSAPIVYMFNAPRGVRPTVAVDNEAAVLAAYRHLEGHGYLEIGFVAGLQDAGPVGERVAAWRAVGGTGEPFRCDYSIAGAYAMSLELLSRGRLPRAIIAGSDEAAIGLLAAAHEVGVGVPEDLAVVSLDGSPMTRFTSPALTVMEQPTSALAHAAVQALLGHEHDAQICARLVVRRSCGC